MSWDYKNKIIFIYRYGAWCGSATRQSSEILVSVYSAQHISFNLLALENHTLLLGLNVFFSFFILYSILSIFGATAFSIYCNKATKGAFVQNFFTFENFQRHFFLDQFKPFFIFCVYHRNFQSDSLNWLKARPAVRIYLKILKAD